MNLNIYQKETLRTFAYRKEPLDNIMTDYLHCAIGIGTEVGELIEAYEKKDIINIGEEIADQMWYISNLANFIELDLYHEIIVSNKITFNKEHLYINESVKLSSDLLDVFKKSIFYNKELDSIKVKNILISMIQNLNNFCAFLDIKLATQLDKNISKLRIRFPDKFTEELAENRNLDAERKELEK